jgi:hypothetical protein
MWCDAIIQADTEAGYGKPGTHQAIQGARSYDTRR